jgi:hypothetical protein
MPKRKESPSRLKGRIFKSDKTEYYLDARKIISIFLVILSHQVAYFEAHHPINFSIQFCGTRFPKTPPRTIPVSVASFHFHLPGLLNPPLPYSFIMQFYCQITHPLEFSAFYNCSSRKFMVKSLLSHFD